MNPRYIPANIYLFKVNNRNTRKRCEIFSKSTIKTPEPFSSISIVDFEQGNISWDNHYHMTKEANRYAKQLTFTGV